MGECKHYELVRSARINDRIGKTIESLLADPFGQRVPRIGKILNQANGMRQLLLERVAELGMLRVIPGDCVFQFSVSVGQPLQTHARRALKARSNSGSS